MIHKTVAAGLDLWIAGASACLITSLAAGITDKDAVCRHPSLVARPD
jgi:hypothetical protein